MNIAFAGDLCLQELNKTPSSLFSNVKKVIDNEHLFLVINLESPFIRDNNIPCKNKVTLYSNKSGMAYLHYLSPNLVNLSNNHINDYGNDSVAYTISLLAGSTIKHWGAGIEGEQFHIYIDSESKLVFLAYTTRSSDFTGSKLFAEKDFYGVKNVDLEEIKDLRKEYPDYMLIVNMHWGIENIKYPEPEKIILGRQIIDAGADVLIGHHPHIVQLYEQYKNKYIFYSIGNFYFNDISFKLNGRTHFMQALAHQKKGLMPVISPEKREDIAAFSLKIGKNDELIVKKAKIKSSIVLSKIPIQLYPAYYRFTVFITIWRRRIFKAITNPKAVLAKLIKHD